MHNVECVCTMHMHNAGVMHQHEAGPQGGVGPFGASGRSGRGPRMRRCADLSGTLKAIAGCHRSTSLCLLWHRTLSIPLKAVQAVDPPGGCANASVAMSLSPTLPPDMTTVPSMRVGSNSTISWSWDLRREDPKAEEGGRVEEEWDCRWDLESIEGWRNVRNWD